MLYGWEHKGIEHAEFWRTSGFRDDNEAGCQRVLEEIECHFDSVSEGAVEAKEHTTSFDLD